MELTVHQQDMMDGKYGAGAAMAMQIQFAVGESFDAPRMIPVSRVHVSLSAQEADIWFAEKLLLAGAKCAVAPTVNPGYCLSYFQGKNMLSPEAISNMEKTHQVYQALGATLTYSCTPYLFGNIPRYGEVSALSETSVTIYANSVLGAKTNRESAASALCAAITGYVPEYGMLLDENRFGTVLVTVDAPMTRDFDYACLGLLGKKIGKGVPVFQGLPTDPSTESLMQLGTQLNVSGSYDHFHIVGVTSDAPDLATAFGGKEPQRQVVITQEDLTQVLADFSPPVDGDIHFVMLGCPHYTYEQILHVDTCLGQDKSAVPFWILTSAAVLNLAVTMGLEARLRERGVELVADTCVDQACCWRFLADFPGASDSPKCAYYMKSFGVQAMVRDVDTCIQLAKKGAKMDVSQFSL